MDRYGSSESDSAQWGVVRVDLEFTAAAAGAVPSVLTRSTWITSVTKSTNDYIVKFDDTYFAFIGGFGNVVQASPAVAGAFEVKHTAFNAQAAGGASVTCTPFPSNGSATSVALAVGDILQYTFFFTRIPQPNS